MVGIAIGWLVIAGCKTAATSPDAAQVFKDAGIDAVMIDAKPAPVTLDSIAVTPDHPSITAGALIQLKATGTFSDATTADLTATVTWASSTTAVATIVSGGLATSATVGTTTISATMGTTTGSTLLSAVTFNKGAAGFNGNVNAIIAAPDGSGDIYIGGEFTMYGAASTPGLARLHSDGSLDTTFVVGAGFAPAAVNALAVASGGVGDLPGGDKDIYVGGAFNTYKGTASHTIVRLSPSGAINAGFVVGTGFDSFSANVNALLATKDGTGDLYAGGQFSTYKTAPTSAIARLHSSGTLAAGFVVGAGFTSTSTTPHVLALAADGTSDIYAGGIFDSYKGVAVASLARLHADGSTDVAFDTAAASTVGSNQGNVRAILPGGTKVLVGGSFPGFGSGAPKGINLVSLNHDGTRDTLFDTARGIEPNYVDALAFAIDGSGDIFVGGFFSTYNAGGSNQTTSHDLIRLHADGSPDPMFAPADNFHYLTSQVVLALLPVADGSKDVYVGGGFTTFGATVVQDLARMSRGAAIR